MLIIPATGLAIWAKASLERSMVDGQPGQWSTIFTVTLSPVHGCGTAFRAPVHLTLNIFPHTAPLSHKASPAAAIITPWPLFPKHAEAEKHESQKQNILHNQWGGTYTSFINVNHSQVQTSTLNLLRLFTKCTLLQCCKLVKSLYRFV